VRAISWPLSNLLARELAGQEKRDIHVAVGEVRVRGTLGTGSRFDLMLPAMIAAGEGPAAAPALAQAGQPRGNWTRQ
jgi:hypothetical protein